MQNDIFMGTCHKCVSDRKGHTVETSPYLWVKDKLILIKNIVHFENELNTQ